MNGAVGYPRFCRDLYVDLGLADSRRALHAMPACKYL